MILHFRSVGFVSMLFSALCPLFAVQWCIKLAFLFFAKYFLYLHFKCYPLSWLPHWKPLNRIHSPFHLLINTSTPTSWPWHSPTLGQRAFTGPRASPPIETDKLTSFSVPTTTVKYTSSQPTLSSIPGSLGPFRDTSGGLDCLVYPAGCSLANMESPHPIPNDPASLQASSTRQMNVLPRSVCSQFTVHLHTPKAGWKYTITGDSPTRARVTVP